MKSNYYVVIMAGGIGSRFWPLSRSSKPKQFLDILGIGKTMIQMTFDRFSTICPPENFLVVTSKDYVEIVKEQLPEIPANNIIGEPSRRNTAPCIAYAAHKIKQLNPLAAMVVTPADHLVIFEENFRDTIGKALDFASDKMLLLTIGIKPTRPETGYGYIQMDEEINKGNDIYKVKTFTEKPDIEMAKIFVTSGEFLWNAGIFIWNVKSILNAFHSHLPEMSVLFDNQDIYNTPKETDFINEVYSKAQSISIDYGIMEKSSDVYVIPADFGWSDLGTWGSLYDYLDKDDDRNVIVSKNAMLYNSAGCIINVSNNRLIVGNGLKNLIIAESDGLLLISALDQEQNIKQIVNDVHIEKGNDFI